MIVVDASVAVKWFIQQQDWKAAESIIIQFAGRIAVPDLFGIEVAAALVREANTDKANALYSRNGVDRLAMYLSDGAFIPYRLSQEQLVKAAGLAIDLGHPLKDCIYLVLAMDLDCPLVTCDAKFVAKAKAAYNDMHLLGDSIA